MNIVSLRVYEGNNIKRVRKIINIKIEEATQEEVNKYLKSYFEISNLVGFKEKLIDVEKELKCFSVYVTYSHVNMAKFILNSINNKGENQITKEALQLINNGIITEIILEAEKREIPVITLEEQIFQLGYGKKSIVLGENPGEVKGRKIDYVFQKEINNKHLCKAMANEFIEKLKEQGIGSIPIISITGTNGKTTTARIIYYILKCFKINAGLTSTGGIFIGDKKIKNGDTTGFFSCREVLTNPHTEVAVLETARGGICRNGLGYEKAAVGVITSISEDHIGMQGINNLGDLLNIKSLVLEEIYENGKIVVKAQRELAQMVNNRGNVCMFSIDKNYYLEKHLDKGGEGFYLDSNYITYVNHNKEKKILDVREVPFTYNGNSKSNILNIMAAIGATLPICNNIESIVDCIKEFQCNLNYNAGRQNILDFGEFKVVLDYGHNSEAFNEVFKITEALKPSKITSIIAAAGDRMDKYIIELGSIAAEYSDFIIIREQADRRGREAGESAALIEQGVLCKGFKRENIKIIYREEEAIIYAMKHAQDGEIIVLFTQCLDVIIPAINQYLKTLGKEPVGNGLDFSH